MIENSGPNVLKRKSMSNTIIAHYTYNEILHLSPTIFQVKHSIAN